MLCNNRFPLPGSPSTCTLDIVVVPPPSFLLFVAVALIFYLRPHVHEDTRDYDRTAPIRWLHITYALLVLAALGMSILEIARLAAANLGVGLLPVTPLAILLVLFLLWYERHARTYALSVLLLVYWLVMTLFEIIKSTRLHRLQDLNPAKDSKYPSSDQLLDNVVMACLYFLFFLLEFGAVLQARRRRRLAYNQALRSQTSRV